MVKRKSVALKQRATLNEKWVVTPGEDSNDSTPGIREHPRPSTGLGERLTAGPEECRGCLPSRPQLPAFCSVLGG